MDKSLKASEMPFRCVGSSSHFLFLASSWEVQGKGLVILAGRFSVAGAAPSLQGRDHKASTHSERGSQRRGNPHGRAQLQLWPVLVQPSLFPGHVGVRILISRFAPGSKPGEHHASHGTSLDLGLLIFEIIFRFTVSEPHTALTFHITHPLFLKIKKS